MENTENKQGMENKEKKESFLSKIPQPAKYGAAIVGGAAVTLVLMGLFGQSGAPEPDIIDVACDVKDTVLDDVVTGEF